MNINTRTFFGRYLVTDYGRGDLSIHDKEAGTTVTIDRPGFNALNLEDDADLAAQFKK